eukprot:5429072-Lingulodinium_polyedra.AAC.1
MAARALGGPPPMVGPPWVTIGGAAGSAAPRTGPEEEASEIQSALQLATLKLVQDMARGHRQKRRHSRIPGLADTGSDNSEEDVPVLQGAKGTAAAANLMASMRKHPKAFADRMEERL